VYQVGWKNDQCEKGTYAAGKEGENEKRGGGCLHPLRIEIEREKKSRSENGYRFKKKRSGAGEKETLLVVQNGGRKGGEIHKPERSFHRGKRVVNEPRVDC